MPKYRVEELEGALLDAAVAKAEGKMFWISPSFCLAMTPEDAFNCHANGDGAPREFMPSVGWEHGGPIIDRERISLTERGADGWFADLRGASPIMGSTPLVAAMRAYVASKFDQEVELP